MRPRRSESDRGRRPQAHPDVVVDYATWPWVFAVPVAIGLVSLVLTLRVIHNSRERTTHAFDVPGSLLSAIAVGGIVLGNHEGPEAGWTSPITLTGLIVGVITAAAFVAWELRRLTGDVPAAATATD